MSLQVKVISASGLPNVERFSKSDPMCVLILQGQKQKTKVIDNNLDPEWNETLEFSLEAGLNPSEILKVEVYDHETVGRNRLLGTLDLSLRDAISRGKQSVHTTLKSKKGDAMQSKLKMEITYTAPAGAGGGGGGGGGGGDGGGGDPDEDEEEAGVVVGGGGGGEEGEGGEGEEGGGGEGGEVTAGGLGSAERKHRARRRKGARGKLPNKDLDFQVRVHILEARKLIGGGLNPVVKVACGKDIKETSSRKGTNNPYFDEMLFFNFKERPEEMFDRVVDIKVLNAKKLIRDSLVGSFKFDLGMVYDEPEHCFIHKWLLLTDPTDPSGGATGYLKFSINIIGPGDDPKPSPSELAQETVDIEANLLRPSGVRLQPGTLKIRIFRGEDMPQMDPGYFEGVKKLFHVGTVQKELVDPYCTVTFAGHKGKTQVIWNEQDPEWNHQVNLPIRFPSMCERVRFQVKDKDKVGRDDYCGTCFLNLSEISIGGEEGFLPTFGPCFLNIYGSPREFTDLPDKYDYLNQGLIEGVSYRGRVMVEVEMALGNFPETKHEEVKIVDQKRVLPFLRRRKYKLFAALYSATMISPVDAAVEFEISIGNYGNKLDDNVPAQSSTTPPTNPVYDGNEYYFLPWMDQKPCVVVDSQWEDCSYRIETLNILLFTADHLEEGVSGVKRLMEFEPYDLDEVKSRLGEVLDEFIENLDQPLPALPTQGWTRLDKQKREYRDEEWRSLQHEAEHLRRAPHKAEDVAAELEDYVYRLRALAVEPQNCIPDVIIWMLSGNKRKACKRIPSHLLMYSSVAKARGNLCGKVQTIFLEPPAVEKDEDLEDMDERAQVRLLLWLGLEKDQSEWLRSAPGGEVAVYAETYENEACLLGRWGTMGLARPNWSDSKGKIKQPKNAFEPVPPGWNWEGDWFMSPELSIAFEPDENLDEWSEDVFEMQLRAPFSSWPPPEKSWWTDVRGDHLVRFEGKEEKKLTRDEMECPDGWLWKGEWTMDSNRAVDEQGWEYGVEAGLGVWVPYERNVHLSRRRRWVRLRVRDKSAKAQEKKKKKRKKLMEEGWEYARLPHLTYHITEHTLDFARRRRWLRKLIAIDPGKPAIFHFQGKKEKKKKKDDDDDDDEAKQQVPRMFLSFKDSHIYQLRAYLYQARDMYSSDKSGLSDPYAVMAFGRRSIRSRVVKESVCPTWDQTLIIKQIRLFGDPECILESPPPVVIEFYDKDTIGENEYLGASIIASPTVRLNLDTPTPRLDWYPIDRYRKYAGELLAAFELLLDEGGELPFTPPTASPPHTHYIVPSGIRPVLQLTRIEVLCWGVRDMKRFQLLTVSSPRVEIECGGTTAPSKHIKDTADNPNFPDPILTFDVYLPKEELYAPPVNIRIVDKRTFGRTPMVGTHIIKSLKDFRVEPVPSDAHLAAVQAAVKASTPTTSVHEGEVAIPLEKEEDKLDTDPDHSKKSEFDWWSKYYYSLGDDKRTQKEYVDQGRDKLKVYDGELEEEFNNFTDLAQTFPLYRGKGARDPEEQVGQSVGLFKGSIKVYPLPDDGSEQPPRVFSSIPSTSCIDVVVRIYVIRGIDLQPQDPGGKSDPYLKVKIGKAEIKDKDNYIPGSLNPLFGKMFELPATLPLDHTLTITVMDWDRISADDLIGETKIDLENRFLSRHRATCGLSEGFNKRGSNKWRDREFPVPMLEDFCTLKHFHEPEWSADKRAVTVDGVPYTLDQFEEGKFIHEDLGDPDQRLALHILRQQNFVPEHVESRTLYNPMQPNISQGSLHMWVDIFPKDTNIPPPVDISPRKPESYVLRIVVWNTKDVLLDETSTATGEDMSDIYVKGWLRGQDETQKTDVHYRSMDGEGNFNWRFVFPFEYLPAEQMMVVRKKEHFYSLSKTEKHLPPRLTMQVWDNDLFNPDDFIGTVDFNLHAFPNPRRDADSCDLDQLPEEGREVEAEDLFKKKRMSGWWPFYEVNEEGVRELTGKVEMDVEIVTEEDSQLRPAAEARDEPNLNPVLEPPKRPATSFAWFTSPLKTFKHIIWKFYKWHIIGAIILIILIILLVIFIYTAPNTLMNWLTSAILPG